MSEVSGLENVSSETGIETTDANNDDTNNDENTEPSKIIKPEDDILEHLKGSPFWRYLEDEVTLPPKDVVRALCIEMALNSAMGEEERLIHKLASARTVENLVKSHQCLLTMLLQIAEDLNVVIEEVRYSSSASGIDASKVQLNVNPQGNYKDSQIAHIAYIIRSKIILFKENTINQTNLATNAVNELSREKEKSVRLVEENKQLKIIPPKIPVKRSYVLFYRDQDKNEKIRTYYISFENNQFITTLLVAKASTFIDLEEATQNLLELLTNSNKHLVPKSYLVEIGKLEISQPAINSISEGKIKSLRKTAFGFESEIKKKASKLKKKSKENTGKEKSLKTKTKTKSKTK